MQTLPPSVPLGTGDEWRVHPQATDGAWNVAALRRSPFCVACFTKSFRGGT